MSKELIFGHQSPDTDAIVAAKALSYLDNKLGMDTEAVALGEPNEETKFVLDYFDEPALRVITKAAPEVSEVMLVDHNEPQQSVSDIADVTVTHVVDHHRIAGFETTQPLFYRAEPLGCCSTVIYKLFKENNVEIPAKLAGLMLSAIISDTLLLKSPTTTPTDVAVVKDLANIAKIDYEAYGLDMLKAGTNLASKSEKELIDADAKSFELNGSTVRVAQINTVDLADVLDRQVALEAAAKAENAAEGYDLFLMLATNILDSNSELIIAGAPTEPVEKAFGKKIENNRLSLPGVVSRKKQVVPPLTDAFNA
ncbi:manganese-dependent inorganic pyrophosphatase [Lactobacillus sp. CBA3606]|uniref:manganese-dependent inorganic pyrophosphatase n=1 Tax=Lactobacillus sp. CBA3606 TaxID=2099789 RepID=UPI000CFA9012|nr:manganese-dependent inorganic pyrophosphatase [Lactobacillus sp. CBA3606]AVK63054.1 manganese-dependent inorganic pyrophosphatase [Lactobacillus sp. CBA3606]